MLLGYHPVLQALFGTLFTWALTAAGSALVFVFNKGQRKILDGSLGFAAGVMTAASYWSLLAPAIEMAERSGSYGSEGQWAFVPVAVGFTIGALFVFGADKILPYLGISDPTTALALETSDKMDKDLNNSINNHSNMTEESSITIPLNEIGKRKRNKGTASADTVPARRRGTGHSPDLDFVNPSDVPTPNFAAVSESLAQRRNVSWKRILLLIMAITIHNIPEGLAVGVGFGAVGKTPSATFESAVNLAIGIGIQNFPEGLAVSLPLRGSGMSVLKSFWYGQLSGLVEPVAGVFGAMAVVIAEPILPYALAFAAGAMIYVVIDDIIPEAQMCGHGTLASWGAILGFVVMMSLDVGLG